MVSSTGYQREYQRAIEAFAQEEYTQAVELFSQVAVARPHDLSLKLWLASAQQQAGQLLEARRNYEYVLQANEDPELVQVARNALDQLRELMPDPNSGDNRTAGTIPLDDFDQISLGGSPFDSDPLDDIDDLFSPQQSGSGRSTSFSDAGNNNPFDDLFDTGLEMLHKMDQPKPNANVGNSIASPSRQARAEAIEYGTDLPLSSQRTTPIEDFFASTNEPQSAQLDEGFAFLDDLEGEGEDLDADNVTQIAQDDAFAFTGASNVKPDINRSANTVQLSIDSDFPTEFASPLSEPIPAPESDTAAARSGPSLMDVDELDSLDKEIAMMDAGEQLDDLFVVPEEGFTRSPAPVAAPRVTETPSATEVRTPSIKPTQQAGPPWLQNRPAANKQLVIALTQGLITLVVGAVTYGVVGSGGLDSNGKALAGAVGGVAAGTLVSVAMGGSVARHVRNTTQELTGNFAALTQGNYSVRATVGANDELGRLASSFNQMIGSIESNITELQQRAAEQGQAKEDLQRQVIRLLDDVEGAARGDLTVRAEVTADVLGAVADSFNLTIRSLRDIVSQVKKAASSVNDAAYQNEEFARGLSADALRQADDIARSLNSVQQMTESIQKVASNAREAAEVGRRATEAALRGGEAVDRTVAGILEIRETVAETTRQVKRLAESSQEINKIVALISQIASRTNLLALNASIEAARAGESGRGFAIVADEVRQLADRAAKSSKEIEQLVLQIQSETKTVMTAMENGTQQVIEGTRRAEQAKDSLDEIIEVSRTIDGLVRSISDATVQQTDTSRSVSQMMQTVELTANETGQESQKVSASLMQLVAIARELQTSVGRFRVGDE